MSENDNFFDGQRTPFALPETRSPSDKECLLGREKEVLNLLDLNPDLTVTICRSAYTGNLYIEDPQGQRRFLKAWYDLEWEGVFRGLFSEIRKRTKKIYELEARY